mmetsp:Transcript_11382/g.21360  ORF Transcript_11382/g.21360 Transcript_11382/m.21360 type:complete len:242 (-) Transcript_11382:166-891(-)
MPASHPRHEFSRMQRSPLVSLPPFQPEASKLPRRCCCPRATCTLAGSSHSRERQRPDTLQNSAEPACFPPSLQSFPVASVPRRSLSRILKTQTASAKCLSLSRRLLGICASPSESAERPRFLGMPKQERSSPERGGSPNQAHLPWRSQRWCPPHSLARARSSSRCSGCVEKTVYPLRSLEASLGPTCHRTRTSPSPRRKSKPRRILRKHLGLHFQARTSPLDLPELPSGFPRPTSQSQACR